MRVISALFVIAAAYPMVAVVGFVPPNMIKAKTTSTLLLRSPSPPPIATIVKSTTDSSSKKEAHEDTIARSTSPALPNDGDTATVESYRKFDDTFILKDVESIMIESPDDENREDTKSPTTRRSSIFGNTNCTTVENKLDISSDPLVNELRVMREMVNSCPEIWTYMSGERLKQHLLNT